MEEPLINAAAVGDVATIRRLAAEGADVNLPGDGGARPLHWAAQEGHVDAAQVLVRLGLIWMHLLLMDAHRCTWRHIMAMWQW